MDPAVRALAGIEISDQWNERLKTLSIFFANFIPVVGSSVSLMLALFWPTGGQADIWAEIQDQVQDLVDSAILAYEMQERQGDLDGLQATLRQYVAALTNEKANLLSSAMTAANAIYSKLTGSSNTKYLLPTTVAMAHLHLGILRERYTHGVELFGENNNATWLSELTAQYEGYREHFEDTYPLWREWRREKVTGEWWVDVEHYYDDPGVRTYYDLNGEAKDTLTGEAVYFHKGNSPTRDEEQFKGVTEQAQLRMQRAAISAMVNQTMIPSFLITTYVPGLAPYVNPEVETVRLGPYSTSTLGSSYTAPYSVTEWDSPGNVTNITVREWNIVDLLQLNYTDHAGKAVGNPSGGSRHVITPPPGGAFTGLRMGFGTASPKYVLKWIEVVMGNVSSARLGNRDNGATKQAYAVMDPAYHIDQWLWRTSAQGISVVEVDFRYSGACSSCGSNSSSSSSGEPVDWIEY